ncbi:unnamed protein product [Taenia asiatica]|uniref:Nucleolar complex protein 2 homolog n=1 Tax=Taenia asiatica TaxID=60517 RepID=A0A0R3WCM6_TAEAS|nr:unnamed protein product [Taenia asiatica]
MYLTYVKDSKFIYGSSIAKNNLMKTGLLEVYSLQLDEAYKHAFVFIRQLAITVRKAFLHTDKEEIRSVYNWQFVCSLKFWCEFVARNAAFNDRIKSLVHPLTQIILGAVSAPMDLRLMLHFSPSQRKETACLDAVAAWLHDLLTEALCLYASSVAFPEYSAAALSEVRDFLKSCRVANFTRDFKALLTKAREHVDLVKRRRATIKSLLDSREIAALESVLGQAESPLLAYYLIHRKIRVRELAILSERFKFEGEEHMKAADDFAQEKEASTKAKSAKAPERRSRAPDEEDSNESDTASDASYDIDDGTNVTHVSRSDQKRRKKAGKGKEGEGSDSGEDDFDLNAALNEDDGDDDEDIANGNEDELKEFRIDDFEDSDDDKAGNARRRQRIMREDPDLEAMIVEESEEEAVDEAEPMDIDMDSFSSGGEEEEEEEDGGGSKVPSSKARRWKGSDKKERTKKFTPGAKVGKVAKKWNSSGKRNSLKGRKKEINWKNGKSKKKAKRS